MAHCPKCGVLNDERRTRCRTCHAILPVSMDAVAAARGPVAPRKVDTAGLPCARCGTINPYSRFKCRQCGVSLTQYKPQTLRERLLVYLGVAMLLALVVMYVLRAL
jgi:ribosomal protein L40E